MHDLSLLFISCSCLEILQKLLLSNINFCWYYFLPTHTVIPNKNGQMKAGSTYIILSVLLTGSITSSILWVKPAGDRGAAADTVPPFAMRGQQRAGRCCIGRCRSTRCCSWSCIQRCVSGRSDRTGSGWCSSFRRFWFRFHLHNKVQTRKTGVLTVIVFAWIQLTPFL